LDKDLFWGPTHALAFVRAQRSSAEGAGWLDEKWAEGGAVIDTVRSRLLWWGGEDALYDIPRRRILFQLMDRTWAGWRVEWAYEGVADLADYVGYPRDRVLLPPSRCAPTLAPPEEMGWTDCVISARRSDSTLVFFPIPGDFVADLTVSDEFLSRLETTRGYDALDLGQWLKSLPFAGAHIDMPQREVTVWSARDAPDAPARFAAASPGWRVLWERDRFESQIELCEGKLAFPRIDRDELVREIRAQMLGSDGRPVDVASIAAAVADGQEVTIAPEAFRDDRVPVDLVERTRIWNDAVLAVK
jgi:hypothetical protein